MRKEIVIYRGPLERARLKLLLTAIIQSGASLDFIWICPVMYEGYEQQFENFIREHPIEEKLIRNDSGIKYLSLKSELKNKYCKGVDKVHFIGFSAYFYAKAVQTKKRIWYVNGIPDEILMSGNSSINKLKNFLQWFIVYLKPRADLVVPVSEPMKDLIAMRLRQTNFLVVPITVDSTIFINCNTNKNYFSYLGSGAAWQALDKLEELWYAISRQDTGARFRVISRDSRCKILARRIDERRIEFVASNDFRQVSQYLSETKMGFLIRREHLVNIVSFPTKYSEYVATGAFVAISDLPWDVSKYVKKFETGILIKNEDSPELSAERIITFLKHNSNEGSLENFRQSTEALSNQYWIQLLSEKLYKS